MVFKTHINKSRISVRRAFDACCDFFNAYSGWILCGAFKTKGCGNFLLVWGFYRKFIMDFCASIFEIKHILAFCAQLIV